MRIPAVHLLIAVFALVGAAIDAQAQQGGFGGTKGGGARPTEGSNLGINRAGTSSSGGFAYGDDPKSPAGSAAAATPPKPPCKVAPVSVNNVPHYKCGKNWYAEPRPGEGYAKVAAPPGN